MKESINSMVKRITGEMPEGSFFRQAELKLPAGKERCVVKALSRLTQNNEIKRIERGLYYKPVKSRFGILKPDEMKLINEITKKANGYITGTSAFNSMGITTQLPKTYVIASKYNRISREVGGVTLKYRKTVFKKGKIKPEILQVLDALKDIKRIPDATVNEVINRVMQIIENFTDAERKELLKLAGDYNASVRALTCSIFDLKFREYNITKLNSSLNPLTEYRINVSKEILPNKKKFRIK